MLVSEYKPTAVRLRRRKYSCDEHYFDELDADRAYWLGFVMAAGCVSLRDVRGYHQFVFSVASKDADHLDKLRTAMRSDHPIHGPRSGCYQLMITSYPLCLGLERHGVVPRKSLRLTMPELPDDLYMPLCRGLIDGDGSFNRYTRRSGQQVLQLSLVGADAVCRWFVARFGGSMSPKRRVYQFQLTGARAAALLRQLYADDAVTHLQRKRERAVALGLLEVPYAS